MAKFYCALTKKGYSVQGDEDESKWVVPEGYLSDDEGIHVRKSHKHKYGIVSRPAKWPIAGNKVIIIRIVLLYMYYTLNFLYSISL